MAKHLMKNELHDSNTAFLEIEIMINRLLNGVDAIIFDIDGTLYDIDDVIKDVYDSQVCYYKEITGLGENEVKRIFLENSILPYKSDKSKSATEFFGKMGLDLDDWSSYKSRHFCATSIDIDKAVKSEEIKQLAEHYIIFAVTSNTLENASKVLSTICIDSTLFREIITVDTIRGHTPFRKKTVFDYLIKKYKLQAECVLSIGDRYDTDINLY